MKIGVMLRHFGQHGGGVRVYTRHLIPELLKLGAHHEWVLLYRDPRRIGTYADYPNAQEAAFGGPRILWDQFAVWRAHRRYHFDLIFNPKYAVPLLVDCPVVWVSHGMDWYLMPWASPWADRISHHLLVPRYIRKAAAIIAVSETTRRQFMQYFNVPAQRVHAVRLGVNEAFARPVAADELERIRRKYQLPKRFFLYVGQIYPPKNFGRLVQAYAKAGPSRGVHLVVAGQPTMLYKKDMAQIQKQNVQDWVVQPGWIDHGELPAFYRLAEALVMPSLYEACPSPPLEAMLSGCPVIAGNRHGLAEVVGDAALLVDPENVDDIAEAMSRVAADPGLRAKLAEAGRAQASPFSWRRCAEQTFAILEQVAAERG